RIKASAKGLDRAAIGPAEQALGAALLVCKLVGPSSQAKRRAPFLLDLVWLVRPSTESFTPAAARSVTIVTAFIPRPRVRGVRSDMAGIWRWMKIVHRSG